VQARVPAGLGDIISQHPTPKSRQQKPEATAPTDQETTNITATSVKPPVPSFRKKKPAIVEPKQADTSSELSSAFSKIHRRANSSGNTETVVRSVDTFEPASKVTKETATEKPTVKPTAAPRMTKPEPAENIPKQKTAEKPTTKTPAAQCMEKPGLTVDADAPAHKQQTQIEKSVEKLSVTSGVGQRTSTTDDVEKPRPPTKTDVVAEKVSEALKPSPSRVYRLALSGPGSGASGLHATDIVQSKECKVEASGDEQSNKVEASGVPKVKLKPTSSVLIVSAAQTARSDGSPDAVSRETTSATEKNKNKMQWPPANSDAKTKDHLFATVEKPDSKPSKAGGILSSTVSNVGSTSLAEKRLELKSVAKNMKSDGDSSKRTEDLGKVGGETARSDPANKSTVSGSKAAMDRTTVSKTKQSDNVKHSSDSVSKSEQTGVKVEPTVAVGGKAVGSSRHAGFQVSKAIWEQKSSSGTMTISAEVTNSPADKPQPSEQCETSASTGTASGLDDGGSFVPVSKRAKVFGSSSVQNDSNTTADAGRSDKLVKTTSLPGGRQYVGKATGLTAKTATPVHSDRNIETEPSQSTDISCDASADSTKASACQGVSVGTDGSQAQSEVTSTKTESCETKDKSVTSASEPSQQGACEAKNEVVIKAAAVGRWPPANSDVKTSVSSQVKPSGISFQKNQPKGSLGEASKSNAAESEKAASNSAAASHKTVSSWVKQPGTSALKKQPKDTLGETPKTVGKEKDVLCLSAVVSEKAVVSCANPSGTSAPENQPKDSSEDTSDTVDRQVTSGCRSAQSEKPSVSSASASTASTNVTTSVIAVETTTSSVSKVTSTSVRAPVLDIATVEPSASVVRPKKSLRSNTATDPVTATEPPWMAIARQKTRVWTDGKV